MCCCHMKLNLAITNPDLLRATSMLYLVRMLSKVTSIDLYVRAGRP
jgi:hypothetical protein